MQNFKYLSTDGQGYIDIEFKVITPFLQKVYSYARKNRDTSNGANFKLRHHDIFFYRDFPLPSDLQEHRNVYV